MAKNSTSTTESKKLVKASARHLHIAPRKLRLVTNMVKGMYVADAIAQLQHTNKKAAPMVIKLLKSAAANAENNFSLNPEFLYIKSITTDMGQVMKRYFPRARGSAFVIRRKLSHVNVELEEKKRGKQSSSKMSFLKRTAKTEAKPVENVDAEDATNKKEVSESKKPQAPKSSEQKKMNTVQQKRRLFNRKGGE